MRQEQLAYPHCYIAICWVELFLDVGDEHPTAWKMLVDSGMSPSEVLEAIRICIRDEVAAKSPGRHAEALAETAHPSFITYLSGKLGAM